MTDAGKRMAGLARPMQHAANNMFMVLQANLDSVQASLPPDDRNAVRLGRALQGARSIEALIRAFLRLGRPEEQSEVDSGKFLDAVLPVLNLAAGKPLKVETRGTATIRPPRPQADLALLVLADGARALAPTAPRTLVLEGRTITVNWALPDGAAEALAEAGMGAESEGEATRVTLG